MSMRSPGRGTRIATVVLTGLLAGCASVEDTVPAPPVSKTPVSLNPMFGDHAVLQTGEDVPVWGWAGPGDTISVAYEGRTATAVADSQGRWTARLGKLAPTSIGSDIVVRGGSTVTLHDIVVGEVWLCSGQSNMEFTVDDGGPVYRVRDAKAEVAAATDPLIRQIRVERTVARAPTTTFKTDGWIPASPETVGPLHRGRVFLRARHPTQHGRTRRHRTLVLGRN